MKKGLLLSIVASTVLFAGGDIAPVEPVAEAPVAACNDFYGHAGVGVIYGDPNVDVDDDAVATYGAIAVLGVNKEIFSGVTFNAEVQGGVTQQYLEEEDGREPANEFGALTQFNLGYTWCNTAIKVGRFAVPAALSPLAATSTDYFGLKNTTFEGVLVANTDLPDTTVWAAYVSNIITHATTDNTGLLSDGQSERNKVSIVAAGLQNKSIADATITLAGYYDIADDTSIKAMPWTYMVAGSIDKKLGNTDISIGAAYREYDAAISGIGENDYMVGGYITQHFGSVDATIAATYVADEDGADDDYAESIGFYKKYTDKTMHGYRNREGWAIGGSLSTDWCGYKLGVYGMYDEQQDYQVGAKISKTVKGIALSTDVRYRHTEGVGIYTEADSFRVRAKAVYKF